MIPVDTTVKLSGIGKDICSKSERVGGNFSGLYRL